MAKNGNVTYIEDLFDLDDVQPTQRGSGKPFVPQSLEGRPPITTDFNEQMTHEMSERKQASEPAMRKIRNGMLEANYRNAMNGGNLRMSSLSGLPQRFNETQNPQPPRFAPQPLSQLSRPPKEEEMIYVKRPKNSDYLLIEENAPYNIPNPNHMNHMNYMNNRQLTCVEIAKHIKECPICSKFYDTDKSIYIIVIIVLAICCIVLLKKLLELTTSKY